MSNTEELGGSAHCAI